MLKVIMSAYCLSQGPETGDAQKLRGMKFHKIHIYVYDVYTQQRLNQAPKPEICLAKSICWPYTVYLHIFTKHDPGKVFRHHTDTDDWYIKLVAGTCLTRTLDTKTSRELKQPVREAPPSNNSMYLSDWYDNEQHHEHSLMRGCLSHGGFIVLMS